MEFIGKNIGYIFTLTIIGFFVYAFNFNNPLFWDDADWILNNPSVHSLNWDNIKFIFTHDVLSGIGLTSNYYRPFLFLTFMGNYIISGAAPLIYHLVSNFIHITNGLLLFYLLLKWLGNRRAAFMAALLFIIHPLQTEGVTYISGRGDPLSILFILVGTVLYIQRRYWWSYLAVILAILSRETAILFPGYLAVALVAFNFKGHFIQRVKGALMGVWPYLVISGGYFLLRVSALNFDNTLNFYSQQNIYSENLAVRLYTFMHALLIYLKLSFWPTGLHMERDIPVHTSFFQWPVWLGVLVVVSILYSVFRFYHKEKVSRFKVQDSRFNIWLFGSGIFFLNLLPTSGIIPINARIYEHWLYFSLAGLFTIVAWYIDKLWSYLETNKRHLVVLLALLIVTYCSFLGIQGIRRNILWGNIESFYRNILNYEPENVRVLNNLGNWLSDSGNISEAGLMYERAVISNPDQPAPYYNLGNIARALGDVAKAEELYKKSIDTDPRFHYAYNNLANLYLEQKRYSEALVTLERLYSFHPTPEAARVIELLQAQ